MFTDVKERASRDINRLEIAAWLLTFMESIMRGLQHNLALHFFIS